MKLEPAVNREHGATMQRNTVLFWKYSFGANECRGFERKCAHYQGLALSNKLPGHSKVKRASVMSVTAEVPRNRTYQFLLEPSQTRVHASWFRFGELLVHFGGFGKQKNLQQSQAEGFVSSRSSREQSFFCGAGGMRTALPWRALTICDAQKRSPVEECAHCS